MFILIFKTMFQIAVKYYYLKDRINFFLKKVYLPESCIIILWVLCIVTYHVCQAWF